MEIIHIKHPVQVCGRVNRRKFVKRPSLVFFYELFDPLTNEICYIGQTENPNRRIKQHYKSAFSGGGRNGEMSEWIRSLNNICTDLFPVMRIVMVLDTWEKSRKIEEKLIRIYWKNGHPLLNRSRHILSRKNYKERVKRLKNISWASQRETNWMYYTWTLA